MRRLVSAIWLVFLGSQVFAEADGLKKQKPFATAKFTQKDNATDKGKYVCAYVPKLPALVSVSIGGTLGQVTVSDIVCADAFGPVRSVVVVGDTDSMSMATVQSVTPHNGHFVTTRLDTTSKVVAKGKIVRLAITNVLGRVATIAIALQEDAGSITGFTYSAPAAPTYSVTDSELFTVWAGPTPPKSPDAVIFTKTYVGTPGTSTPKVTAVIARQPTIVLSRDDVDNLSYDGIHVSKQHHVPYVIADLGESFQARCDAEANGATVRVIGVVIKRGGVTVSGVTTDVSVGEKISLSAEAMGVVDEPLTVARWNVSGRHIKDYTQDTCSGVAINLTNGDLQQPTIDFYWIDGGGQLDVSYSVNLGGIQCQNVARFDVSRPSFDMISFTTDQGPPVEVRDGQVPGRHLIFRTTASPGIRWASTNNDPVAVDGSIAYLQLINTTVRPILDDGRVLINDIAGQLVLDDAFGIQYTTAEVTDGSGTVIGDDSPSIALDVVNSQLSRAFGVPAVRFERTDRFKTYLMYKPKRPDSIWVTLRLTEWNWSGSCDLNVDADEWTVDAVTVISSENPMSINSIELPEWTNAFSKQVFNFVPKSVAKESSNNM